MQETDVVKLFDDHEKVTRAISLGARDALIKHKALGVPIASWQDGQVVLVSPEDIVIPEVE